MVHKPELAHLRFADNAYAAVQALQRVRPVQAKDAREVYDNAPDGWYVVTMQVEGPRDMIGVIAKVTEQDDIDCDLLACDVRGEGHAYVATFFNLRGMAQSVH
ncbi:MAG TPA: hypothetical protein VJQ81_20125 [Reyranella sp.]|nr:hypothetical protein [Reyranella sp.]